MAEFRCPECGKRARRQLDEAAAHEVLRRARKHVVDLEIAVGMQRRHRKGIAHPCAESVAGARIALGGEPHERGLALPHVRRSSLAEIPAAERSTTVDTGGPADAAGVPQRRGNCCV